MKLYIVINAVILTICLRLLFYASIFSLASKEFIETHWKPHRVQFFFNRLIFMVIVMLILSISITAINWILIKISGLKKAHLLRKTIIFHILLMVVFLLGFVLYSTLTL
jgi:hypothetical protein